MIVKVGLVADDKGFYVADDGPGFSDESRAETEEFEKTDGLSKMGIGLMSVINVVDAHGWGLTIPDTDHGARIEIRTGEQSG